MAAFSDFGPWVEFGLQTINDSIEMINRMGGRGVEVVETREGDYRYWDPETLKVDKEAEDLFLDRLRKAGIRGTVLSEEAGTVTLEGGAAAEGLDDEIIFISDPFDGSLLYKRQIPAFWFTTLAIFTPDGDATCCVVGDCAARAVDFCGAETSYTARLVDGGLADVKELKPRDTAELKDAFLESYLMKPHYMYPSIKTYEPVFGSVKFIHPNGGPSGFSDVAAGRVDVYFAIKQPLVDVFTGLPIALKAGCVVTDFEGNPVPVSTDINARFNVICAANQGLHDQVMAKLGECQS